MNKIVSFEGCKKKDPGNYKPVRLTLVEEKTILKALSKHMMDKVRVLSID